MFNVQVVARLGWDGVNQPLADYDIGWRDTVQFDPLTIMYLAIKPIVPIVPWQLPNSIRPLSPSDPINSTTTMMMGVDSTGSPITSESNILTNFGWEYMVHCHLLGHEENDMMRTMAMGVALVAPTALSATGSVTTCGGGRNTRQCKVVSVSFAVNSINATGFELQRFDESKPGSGWTSVSSNPNFWTKLLDSTSGSNLTTCEKSAVACVSGNWDVSNQKLVKDYSYNALGTVITFKDNINGSNSQTTYQYRVIALNQLGTQGMGTFPTVTSKSDPSNIVYVTL